MPGTQRLSCPQAGLSSSTRTASPELAKGHTGLNMLRFRQHDILFSPGPLGCFQVPGALEPCFCSSPRPSPLPRSLCVLHLALVGVKRHSKSHTKCILSVLQRQGPSSQTPEETSWERMESTAQSPSQPTAGLPSSHPQPPPEGSSDVWTSQTWDHPILLEKS